MQVAREMINSSIIMHHKVGWTDNKRAESGQIEDVTVMATTQVQACTPPPSESVSSLEAANKDAFC